jgi:nucleotide-binding universal stress UspA family protein
VSLLVVRSLPELPYRRLTVAVDFSPQSTTALQAARRLAPSAALRLVNVVHVPDPFQQAMLRAGASHADMESFRTGLYNKARADLAALVATLELQGRAVTRVMKNEPGAALLKMSKGPRADLMAVGADGRGAVRGALLGHVTRRLLSEAGCDVLVGR